MGKLSQFRLLLWKSVLTSIRSPIWTAFEIALPFIAFVLILVLTRQGPPVVIPPRDKGQSHYTQFDFALTYSTLLYYWCDERTCTETNQTLNEYCEKYNCATNYVSESSGDLRYNLNSDFHKFNDKELDVTLYGYSFHIASELHLAASSEEFNFVDRTGYGLEIANYLTFTFIRDVTNKSMRIFFHVLGVPDEQPLTFPVTMKHEYLILLIALVPMLAAINVTREISAERESNMKQYLIVMGMSRGVYYIHHFVYALLKALPATIAVSILIIIDQVYIGFHFLLAYLLFVGVQIAISALISSIIKKSNIATLTAFVVIPFTSALPILFPVMRTSTPLSYVVCLNPGHGMQLAIDALKEAAYRGNTVYWFGDLNYALPFGPIVIIMVFDILLFLIVAIAIDYFASTTENIFSKLKKKTEKESHEEDLLVNIHETDAALAGAKVDIELCNVHKTWPSGERAVRGINVKLYRGQVTVLLGHNGAGKSTTFAMITGIVVPSSGTIKVGESDGKGAQAARQSLVGYCPQYNPIFARLNVNEHLDFFARLKGVKEWREEGEKLLQLLLLTDKAKTQSSRLSGGMKRKLCIAMALIGKSRVVLLDEPTAGVDTGARRDIECLLMQQKRERTFLLTTHYTDEAENLGDRILIMAGGKIVCSGSPHFLNREFGAGYILSCVSIDSKRLHEIANKTLELVKWHISNAKAERQHGQQFEIWMDKEECDRFPDLFRSLEEHYIDIGIESYGLSMNTLEQVFLRVGEMTGAKNRETEVNEALKILINENNNRVSGLSSIGKRFLYLQYKRAIYEMVNFRSFLFYFLPMIAIMFGASQLANLSMDFFSGGAHTVDLLAFPRCARIGIEKSTGLFAKLQAILQQQSLDCLVLEEIDSALDWYEQTAMARRPPILAAISRNDTAGGIVVHRALNQWIAIPALTVALLKAMSSKTINLKMDYSPMPNFDGDNTVFREAMYAFAMIPFLVVVPLTVFRAIGFYVVERSVKFGHQQFLTGLSKYLYWSAAFVSECWIFVIYYVGMIVFSLIFGFPTSKVLNLTPLLLLCAIINLLKIFIIQRIFTSKIKAENFAAILLVIEYFAFAAFFLFNGMAKQELNLVDFVFRFDYPYLLDPQVAILAHVYNESIKDVSTVYIIVLVQIFVFLAIFCLLECDPLIKVIQLLVTPALPQGIGMFSPSPSTVQSKPRENLVLEVDNLVKRYGRRNIAVKSISFGVMEHECFGLLGVNGAGKTSTFEVLTGNATATAGSATVAGVDCSKPARIGYCPQFDALMEEMSGRQNLLILAALHGYANPGAVTDTVIECVGMTAHANKSSKSYSGGQRRKISVAGALLAQNSLIILDEPTAGIDPVTRRDIWSVICALRDSTKTAIVLTSHSMDEVEALCSRVAIMRAGQIAAQGSSQTLKSRYGNYFKLSLVVPSERPETVTTAVKDMFPKANQLVGSTSTFSFEIPRDPGMLWSEMFTSAIKVAKTLNAKDYCLSQASLEDAFIVIAGESKEKQQEFDYPYNCLSTLLSVATLICLT